MPPDPIVPDYAGANVRGIVPALLGPADWSSGLPAWMPSLLADARQIVLLVLDGLGWDQLQERTALAPTIAGLAGGRITTVAPTTTSTALSSIATGLTPGEHGLIGYRIVIGGEVMNVLRWAVDGEDRRRVHPPADVQRFPGFLGHAIPIVSPIELCATAFSEAHMRGAVPVGVRATSSIAVEVGRLLRDGERFVHAYYGGVDKVAHERGFGPFYDAELRAADRLVGDVLDELPPGAALLVTADHGQVHIGDNIVSPPPGLLDLCALQSGEGRFRWLHARRGAAGELLAAARERFSEVAWVRSRDELVEGGWFGPTVAPDIANRLGDVALVAHADISFDDPDDSGPYRLVCRHGSMTAAEVYVPLLAGMRA
jgi:hypothetical protein